MANKPIISIDVDDSAFEKFFDLFKEYSAKLDEMPEAWETVNAAMAGAGDALKDGAVSGREALALAAAQATIIADAIKDASKAQDEFTRATGRGDKRLKEMGKTAASLGRTLLSITRLGLAGLGLGALAGGFGFDALAGAALSRQRSANALGLTPGQLASFQVNAQQFLGTDALTAAAGAQVDVTKAGYLAALGIDFGKASRMSASDLAFDELKAARAAWLQAQRSGISPLQMPAVSSYLALGGSQGDIRNAAMTRLSDINAAQRATNIGAGGLDFDRQTAADWIKLKKAFDSAGFTIETGLIRALAPLAPEIAQISTEVVKFINAFLTGPDLKVVVGDVKAGLHELGTFLTTTDWKKVGSNVAMFGAEIGVIADKFKWLLPQAPAHTNTIPGWGTNNLDMTGPGPGTKALQAVKEWLTHIFAGRSPKNNPLNMKVLAGNDLAWAQFDSTDAGIKAAASRILSYKKNWGANTLASLIPIWNGHGANSGSYIANVEKWSGISRNAPIDKMTVADIAKIISAMSRMEGTDRVSVGQALHALQGGSKPAPQRPVKSAKLPVQISVTNSTSARVAVSVNAAALA